MIYNEYLVNDIRDKILDRGETVAVAESVTAGNIQAALSLAADASQFFQGGITVYNIGQKVRHLNVEPISAEKTDCVSGEVSATMAVEAAKMFISHYGVGITGYASIVPENQQEGLYAFVAISYRNEVLVNEKIRSEKKDTYEVQVDFTNQALKLLLGCLAK